MRGIQHLQTTIVALSLVMLCAPAVYSCPLYLNLEQDWTVDAFGGTFGFQHTSWDNGYDPTTEPVLHNYQILVGQFRFDFDSLLALVTCCLMVTFGIVVATALAIRNRPSFRIRM